MWIVMIKSLRYYIKSLCIKNWLTLMKFRISYICTYIIILLRFERINERTKVFFFNVEITFHNSLCTHIEEFLDDARPSISEKRVQLP